MWRLFGLSSFCFTNACKIRQSTLRPRRIKKCTFLSVNVFTTKVLIVGSISLTAAGNRAYTNWKHFLSLQLETGPPFYVVILVTGRSNRLQCKGSTFISQLNQDPEYWSGLRPSALPVLPLTALPTELILPQLETCMFTIERRKWIEKRREWKSTWPFQKNLVAAE